MVDIKQVEEILDFNVIDFELKEVLIYSDLVHRKIHVVKHVNYQTKVVKKKVDEI